MASQSRFRASIATWMVVLVADLVVAWGLYLFLRPVSADLSLLTAWLRLVYVAIAAGATLKLLSVSDLLGEANEAEALQPDQRAAQATRDLNLFNYGYKVGWVFFGLHIFGLGYLIARSDYVPVVLAILLIIASVGYLTSSFSSLLSSDYANNEILTLVFVAVPAIIAELSLTVWLLIGAGKGPAGAVRWVDGSCEPPTRHGASHHRTMVNRMTPDAETTPDGARLLPRGPFTRWPRVADTVLAIVMFVFVVLVEFEEASGDVAPRVFGDLSIVAFLVVAAACGALIWRRSQPLVVLGVTLAAIALSSVLGYPETVGFAMLVALYSVGRYVTDDRSSYAGVTAAITVATIGSIIDEAPLADLAFGFLALTAVWYIGRRVRARGDYLRLLHDRAELREREQEAAAQRAVVEERTRIARELHDVVAHRVTMMTVQAGAAKTIAADDPEGALQAMEAVEDAGREALGELRHLLGVLRPEAEADGLGPQPGVADVPRLLDQFREAGLDVSLTMDGVRTDLPAPVDLSTYRIVQEALTNVLKHAGPSARTEVRLSTDNDEVTIEVLDNGHGATVLPGAGQGILGMRERATLLGGSLAAGPLPDAGFRVVAHLPVKEEPA